MIFFVETLDSTSKRSYGIYQEDNIAILLVNLKKNKLIPLSIRELPSIFSVFVPTKQIRIKPEEVIELIESLHLIIKSGLPLYSGLLDLAEDASNPKFRKMLLLVAEDIQNGKSLSSSFLPYEKSLGNMMINLIHIGEETGQLQNTLQRGAQFLKRTHALKKKAKQALIYPSFALAAVSTAMMVWMIFVLPQMTQLFKEMNIELPALTLFMIALSTFISEYIGYIIIFFIFIVILFKILHHKFQPVRFHTDQLLLKIPVIKQIISGFNMAFIAEYIRLALISGIPLFSALDILKNNLRNEVFQSGLKKSSDDVSRGLQLSASFKKTGLFSPFMVRMMGVGEESGTLDSQLDLIAEHYQEKVDYYAENIGKIIEPLVLIFVGGFMALVMVGLMGPMYDLIDNLE